MLTLPLNPSADVTHASYGLELSSIKAVYGMDVQRAL